MRAAGADIGRPKRTDRELGAVTSLGALMDCWRREHRTEQPQHYRLYANVQVNSCSFVKDGILSPRRYTALQAPARRYLFISKEANISADGAESWCGKGFWLREVAAGSCPQTNFSRRLGMLYSAAVSGDFARPDKSGSLLPEIAFMNLNKRGGASRCCWHTLRCYTQKYAGYIRREIELIGPQVIVCCGGGVQNLLEQYVGADALRPYTVLSVYHPSYRCADEKHLAKLHDRLLARGLCR